MSESPSAADSVADIDLFSTETLIDPYDAYRTLRDHAPVHFVPSMNVHVVTRYDLLREAIRDTERFSSKYDGFLQASQQILFESAPAETQARLLELDAQMVKIPPTMLTLDEPEHTRFRSLVAELFTASRIREAEAAVQAVIDDCADTLAQGDALDFMEAFGAPVPLHIIATRLGIPDEDRAFFYEAATSAASALRLSPLTPEQLVRRSETALALQRLLIRLAEARREEPADDMISILANSRLEDEDRLLTHGELLSVLNQFLVAGHETTSSTFGWGMLMLCKNPGLEDSIRGEPKRIRTFVEESLRVEAPVQGLPRVVTRDTELGGYPLPAGSMIMLRYGAANRDERQFEDPDTVNVERAKAGMQMAFGSGVHHCIGAPLARQELNLGFATLLDRFEGFTLDEDYPPPQAEPSFILRNLPVLRIRYRKR